MSVEELIDLRTRIDKRLGEQRTELANQLERISRLSGARVVRGGGSKLRGRKVPAKYRDPKTGMTWSGHGARAKWLVGKKLSDYLIDKPARNKRA